MEGRMKLSDFVIRESIIVDLQATGKEEAIREMVGSLHKAGKLADGDVEGVIRAILGREELGSTGIGMGVAVPHTRHTTLTRLIGTVALSKRGVDFAALDGDPVTIFFLLVSPQSSGEYFATLEGRALCQLPASGRNPAGGDRRARGSRPAFAMTKRPRGR